MPDTTEGKVTLAVISTKLDLLLASNNEMRVEVAAIRSCQDKMEHIPPDVIILKDKVDTLETDVARLQTKTTIIGGFSGIASLVAGIVGSIFGPRG